MKSLQFTEIKSINENENDQVADVDIEPPIYNSVSSCQNPITWGEYMKYSEISGLAIPSILSVWYYCFTLNRYLWLHNIYVIFTHLLPAIIIDTLARLTGKKPMYLFENKFYFTSFFKIYYYFYMVFFLGCLKHIKKFINLALLYRIFVLNNGNFVIIMS